MSTTAIRTALSRGARARSAGRRPVSGTTLRSRAWILASVPTRYRVLGLAAVSAWTTAVRDALGRDPARGAFSDAGRRRVELGGVDRSSSRGSIAARAFGASAWPLSQNGVAIEPGSTIATSTPNWRISWRSESPIASSACLEAL